METKWSKGRLRMIGTICKHERSSLRKALGRGGFLV